MSIQKPCAKLYAIALIAIIFSGCALVPATDPPEIIQEIRNVEKFKGANTVTNDNPIEYRNWWRDIGGSELDQFVSRLMLNSITLKESRLRAQQAHHAARVAFGQRLPSVNLITDISSSRRQDLTGEFATSQNYVAALNVDFNTDIFGGLRSFERVAKLNALASELSVSANEQREISILVKNWISAATLQRRLQLAIKIADSFQATYQLTKKRYEAGSTNVSATDVQIALQNFETAMIDIPLLETDLKQQLLSIDEQLAHLPGTVEQTFEGKFCEALEDYIPLGVPARLLRARPDVAIAELNYLAALQDIGAARASLYPSISLNASLTFQADTPSDVFDWDRHVASLANSLLAPIFQGGRLRAQLRFEEAQAEELAHSFGKAALAAVTDVEITLAEIKGLQAQLVRLKTAHDTAKLSNKLVQGRYNQGLSSILTVLETQRSYNATQQNILLTEQAIANARVDLFYSLGGKWAGQASPSNTELE
jgi:NodT family efflux transporter outer membrane factor (OMF) lipoprotein